MVLPPTPRRSAAMEMLGEEEVFQNPVGTGEMGEVLIGKDLFKTGVKVGDEVLVRATVSSLGSKIGVSPFEVLGQGEGHEPQPEGNPPQTEDVLQ